MKNDRCVPIEIIQMLSRKWGLLILSLLVRSKSLRYTELNHRLNGISPKTLTERLRELEKEGIVTREMFSEIPPRVEYSLTKKGNELAISLEHVLRWAEKWYPEISDSNS
jgi:DNA-binding HxlR family transcriptional regulator